MRKHFEHFQDLHCQ